MHPEGEGFESPDLHFVTFIQNGHKRKGKLVHCKVCNKIFPTRLGVKQTFCSIECVNTYRSNLRTEFECRWCNKKFFRRPSTKNNSRSGMSFCGRKCKEEAQRLGGIKEIMPVHYR